MQKYTEKDVAQLIANVEQAFTAQLAKAKVESLAKSEDGEKHEEKPEHEAKEHESEGHEEGEKHEEKPEHEEHHAEGHDYDEEDMAHMEKMYRSMAKGELAAHHDCIKKCMGEGSMAKAEIESCEPKGPAGKQSEASHSDSSQMKKSDGNGGEMSASEPKGSPGAKSAASKEQDKISTEMAKTETGKIESCEPGKIPGAKSPASKAEGVQMEKSENTEVELLKAELAASKAEQEAVKEFLTAFVKKAVPQGKAITSLDVIAKSEAPKEEKSFTKGEILEILKTKTLDPSLKKSDRDAINSFYLNGQVSVNSISHLLK